MLKKLQDYIINSPWDEWLERNEKYLEHYVLKPFLAFAFSYFAIVCFLTLWRMHFGNDGGTP